MCNCSMPRIRLLSTDFDGTLIGHASDGRCARGLARALRDHKAAGGLWAVNTGRGIEHAIEGIERFDAPVTPDFLLTNEREIFRSDSLGGWEAYGEWNIECERRHRELFLRAKAVFRHIESLARRTEGVSVIYEAGDPMGIVTSNEELMHLAAGYIDQVSGDLPEFGYQRNTIYLRFCHRDYDKGSALAELCRLEGIPRETVLAVGDHFNDIPMLDGRHAVMVGCPANAIREVKNIVQASQGYLAEGDHAHGVSETIAYFTNAQ